MTDFAMMRAAKRFRAPLMMGVIVWFVLFPAYLNLFALDEWDAIFPYVFFKNIDQDDSVAILEHKEKILIPTFVVKHYSEVNPLFERILDFSLYVFASCSKPLFLRC
jgi:hypothetical protein